jgi:type III pantothenate kinase
VNNLLIDIGNSDIKLGIGKPISRTVNFIGRYSYSKKDFKKNFNSIFNKLKLDYSFKKIGLSVLDNSDNEFLSKFFSDKFKLNPDFITRDYNLPVRINYSAGLGNDRICSAAAAVRLYNKKNLLVIDFGTASTYTLISEKTITGGLISPGIKTSLLSLIERTSLPAVNINFPKNLFNNNTVNNIKAGVLYQSLYSTERIILEAAKKQKDLFVVATGGYSKLISGKTKLINKVDPHLVLKGINFLISE